MARHCLQRRAASQCALRGGEWPQALFFFALHGCPFPHASILARKDIFDLFGGYPHAPEFAHCEDFALWGSWVRFFKVATLPEVLLDYTVHPDQKSAVHTGHQQHGTDRVQAAFRALPQSHRIPEAVAEIAGKLNLPLLAASKVLCRAWMYHRDILVDRHLYEPAQVLFPDRSVHVVEEVRNVLADRVFYLHAGPADPAILQQFRVVRLP